MLTGAVAALALAIFVPLFATGGIGALDFWWWMSGNAALLMTVCWITDPGWRAHLADDLRARLPLKLGVGLGSAVVLYFVFFAGNELAPLILPTAGGEIDAVYGLKAGSSELRVGLLIGLLIGPAEELFWRAFLQRRLSAQLGPWRGFAIATLAYAGMHIASGNLMLVLAAALCGVFWGYLYLRLRSVWLNVISHLVWDLAVFMFFPFS